MIRIVIFLLGVFLCSGFIGRAQDMADLTLPPIVRNDTCSSHLELAGIVVSGNKRTGTDVIIRELCWPEGTRFCKDSLDYFLHLSYQRLYNLNLFADILFRTRVENDTLLYINIDLKEQWFIIPQADLQLADRNVNVWWNEQNRDMSRINLGLYLQHKNISGRLDRLNASIHVGYTQQLTINYFRPYIDRKKKQGLSFAGGISRSREIAYNTVADKLQFTRSDQLFLYRYWFARAQYIYRPAYHSRHIVGVEYNDYKVGDTVLMLNRDFFENSSADLRFITFHYRFEYNGVDNWNYPRRGYKLLAQAEQSIGLKGLSRQSVVSVESGFFKPLAQRWYASFILRAKYTFLHQYAYFTQPALGYRSDLVRGYEYYVIPANTYCIARLNLKYEAVRSQINRLPFRYLPKLPVWLYPKLFVDAGYAVQPYKRPGNFLQNTILYSFGFGFDFITAYDLKLRVEFALNHLGENGLYLHANSE